MSAPRVFYGRGGGNSVYEAGTGHQDDGQAINVRMRTVRWAPGGEGAEGLYAALYLPITHTMAVTLRVTPYVDGVALDSQDIVLVAQSARVTVNKLLGLSVKYLIGGIEKGRVAARGTWLEVNVESIGGLAAGDLLIDGVNVEHEVVGSYAKAQTI